MGPSELVYIGHEGQSVWIEAQTSVGTLYLRQDTAGHLYTRLMGPRLETKAFDRRLRQMSAKCANELAYALQDESTVGVHGAYLCQQMTQAIMTQRVRRIRGAQRALEVYLHCPNSEEWDSILALLYFALEKATLSSRGNEQRT